MANTNCLDGMKCPKCGSEGPFKIAGTALFTVSDEGTEEYGDVEWDNNSYCHCPECDLDGIVYSFKTD
jgi:hypothetical protein